MGPLLFHPDLVAALTRVDDLRREARLARLAMPARPRHLSPAVAWYGAVRRAVARLARGRLAPQPCGC